jgi:hypothetical protein
VVLGWLARRRGWEISSLFSVEGIRNLGWLGQILLCAFAAWFGAYIFYCRYLVPCGTDALAYHLTMPVYWLKSQDLSLVPMFSTAALLSYSPINGEIFLTWLVMPFGNDVVVRFAQMPFLIVIMLSLYAIWRRWSVPQMVALGAAGLVLVFRPFLREIVLPNIDLMLTAWVLTFACQFQRLDGSWQSWTRGGLALGLMVGTKLFGLLYLVPCLLLLAGKHFQFRRARPFASIARDWACLVAAGVFLGAFTYARNWIATGNPFFPAIVSVAGVTVFEGLILSDEIAGGHHDLNALLRYLFGNGTFGMPARTSWIWGTAVAGSVIAWMFPWKRSRREPGFVWLWLLLGMGFVVVAWKSPFLDERYLFPVFALGILFIGWLVHRVSVFSLKWLPYAVLAGIAVCFAWGSVIPELVRFAIVLMVLAWVILRIVLWFVESSPPRARVRMTLAAVTMCALLAFFWTPFLRTYQEIKFSRFPHVYPGQGSAWVWLNEQTKAYPAIIAYTGSAFIYPLFGQDLQNSLVYIPISEKGYRFLHEMDHRAKFEVDSHQAGTSSFARIVRDQPDMDSWKNRILDARANFLVVQRDIEQNPIESEWAEKSPGLFRKVFEGGSVTVYQVASRGAEGAHP